jgi:hypothetical protein
MADKVKELLARIEADVTDDRQVTVRDKLTGKVLFEWNDNAQCDYPEDLCWYRQISGVFYDGIRAAIQMLESEPGTGGLE